MRVPFSKLRRRQPMPCGGTLFALIMCPLFLTNLRAELKWAQKTAELHADAGTETLEARFRFTNTGSTPVDIRQVESSCGCTTTELAERHYEPGKGGEIVARYTAAGRLGLQRKTIAVFSSDQTGPTTLTLIVHIPEIMSVQPAFVTWAHDEPAKPKTIILELLQDQPLKDITVQSSNAGVATTLEPLVKGRKYLLTITPARTSQFLHAILTVRGVFGEKEQSFRAYATVQPPLSRQ